MMVKSIDQPQLTEAEAKTAAAAYTTTTQSAPVNGAVFITKVMVRYAVKKAN